MNQVTAPLERRTLGQIESARSRHMWTRSSVLVSDDHGVVTGQWDGTVSAFTESDFDLRWSSAHPESAVGLASIEDTLFVAGRGKDGSIGAYDSETGDRRWLYETADDVGRSSKDSVFYRPYVVDMTTSGERMYAATRRYERERTRRQWYSAVIGFDLDGSIQFRYETDASPISLALDDDGGRLAIAYNRCMGEHDNGLVVLDTETGDPVWTWDPGTEGDRRVGDVSFDGDRIAVASHGDKRGYLLGPGGREQWSVDLAVETAVGGESLYAYPIHAYTNGGAIAFVTGNTYAKDSRETDSRHPNEHSITSFDAEGNRRWSESVGGFVHSLGTEGSTLVAPCAQNFRVRDPETHGLYYFDLEQGPIGRTSFEGIATAAAVSDGTVAAIEEPVEYHDEGSVRGNYTVHLGSIRRETE